SLLLVYWVPLTDYLWLNGTEFRRDCQQRINSGMTLEEVETILGAGTRVKNVPELQEGPRGRRPAVTGDEFYLWERDHDNLWVGFKDGKVCDTFFWTPNL